MTKWQHIRDRRSAFAASSTGRRVLKGLRTVIIAGVVVVLILQISKLLQVTAWWIVLPATSFETWAPVLVVFVGINRIPPCLGPPYGTKDEVCPKSPNRTSYSTRKSALKSTKIERSLLPR